MVGSQSSGGEDARLARSGKAALAADKGGRAYLLIPTTIRGKLILAFGVILLSAAAGALVGHRANLLVQQQLSAITEDNLPSLVTAHRVSEVMTNIRSVAAAMATAESEPALSSRRTLLQRHLEDAEAIINQLEEIGVERRAAAELNSNLADVGRRATLVVDLPVEPPVTLWRNCRRLAAPGQATLLGGWAASAEVINRLGLARDNLLRLHIEDTTTPVTSPTLAKTWTATPHRRIARPRRAALGLLPDRSCSPLQACDQAWSARPAWHSRGR